MSFCDLCAYLSLCTNVNTWVSIPVSHSLYPISQLQQMFVDGSPWMMAQVNRCYWPAGLLLILCQNTILASSFSEFCCNDCYSMIVSHTLNEVVVDKNIHSDDLNVNGAQRLDNCPKQVVKTCLVQEENIGCFPACTQLNINDRMSSSTVPCQSSSFRARNNDIA